MTDCENAEMRDLLPDVVAGRLSDVESARVRRHVEQCVECQSELALLRSFRALPLRTVSIDVAGIVASLPRPAAPSTTRDDVSLDPSIVSIETRRGASGVHRAGTTRRGHSVWKMAATIGVIIAGGWSVVMVQSGGIGMMTATQSDSTGRGATGDSVDVATTSVALAADTQASDTSNRPAASAGAADRVGAAVSFGDVGNYTDEELQRVLERLDRWDGATSTESVTTSPILPVTGGGVLE